MNVDNSLDWFNNIEPDDFEDFKLDFAVAIERAINSSGMNKKEVANILGVSPARVTNILRGDANLTMEVMHKLAKALNHKIHICLAPENAKVHTFTSFIGQNQVFSMSNTNVMNPKIKVSAYSPLAKAA